MASGIDRVDRARIQRLTRSGHFNPGIVCTPAEVVLFKKSKNRTLCFALLFGAKEATSKALKHPVASPGMLKSYEVFFEKGKPFCRHLSKNRSVACKIFSINRFF